VRLRAPAKINLLLRVLGRRNDGYHDLVSLAAKLTLADGLTIAPGGRGFTLSVPGVPALERDDNTVLRAAVAFRNAFGSPRGATLVLRKRVPVTAGLGGGSSDAAATLRGLSRLTGLGTRAELAHLGAEVGSDVPLFLHPGPVIMEGRGERVRGVPQLPELWVLLVKPDLSIRAAEAYAFFDAAPRQRRALTAKGAGATSTDRLVEPNAWAHDPGAVARMLGNDLQPGCVERFPALRRILQGLARLGSLGCAMSGSGPTCFALFSTRALAERARERFERSSHIASGDWVAVTALRRGRGRLAG
jgi:4-diphosphocytidyl-2-C-methyl-D-erythritol kinase